MIILLSSTTTMQETKGKYPVKEHLFPAESVAVRLVLEKTGPSGRAEIWNIKDKLLDKTEKTFNALSLTKPSNHRRRVSNKPGVRCCVLLRKTGYETQKL